MNKTGWYSWSAPFEDGSPEGDKPLVSVVIAAYNSSAKLVSTVKSVLAQTVTDLEILVVGDGVTDDSEERLNELADSRIQWRNLPQNWGEQSVPSNAGLAAARGQYVAFLNQDDLWLPRHLETHISALGPAKPRVCLSPYLVVPVGKEPTWAHSGDVWRNIKGVSSWFPRFDPRHFYPASCVVWEAEVLRNLGGWRTAGDTHLSPSQDLLFRAWRKGFSMRVLPQLTTIVLYSGARPGSYSRESDNRENAAWLRAIQEDPDHLDLLLGEALKLKMANRMAPGIFRRGGRFVLRILHTAVGKFGLHPSRRWRSRHIRGNGDFINLVRRVNKLPDIDFIEKKKEWFG